MNTSICRSCGERILWAKTQKGKLMPIDAEPVEGGNLSFDDDGRVVVHGQAVLGGDPLYQSHFVSCVNADEHRRKQ